VPQIDHGVAEDSDSDILIAHSAPVLFHPPIPLITDLLLVFIRDRTLVAIDTQAVDGHWSPCSEGARARTFRNYSRDLSGERLSRRETRAKKTWRSLGFIGADPREEARFRESERVEGGNALWKCNPRRGGTGPMMRDPRPSALPRRTI